MLVSYLLFRYLGSKFGNNPLYPKFSDQAFLVTRRRPVTGQIRSELQFLTLGPNFCNDRLSSFNASVRTMVQLYIPGQKGSANRVSNTKAILTKGYFVIVILTLNSSDAMFQVLPWPI